MYVDLDTVKHHLNLDPWFDQDDPYILGLISVAEQTVATHLDDKLDIIMSDNNGELPTPIIHAMCLLIGNLYANREGIAFAQAHEIPYAYQYLLAPYKNYVSSQL